MADVKDIETQADDLLELAWGVIANARDWILEDKQADTWCEAATRWRDAFHASLPNAEA